MKQNQFFNINTFLSSPIKKQSSLQSRKKTKSKSTYSKTSKNNNKNISSIFNRTFFVPSLKKNKLDQNNNLNIKSNNLKQIEQIVDNSPNKSNTLISPQKIRQNTQPDYNYNLIQGVKTKSLTFEYYYKRIKQSQKKQKSCFHLQETIKQSQKKQKSYINLQDSQKNTRISFAKQYASNLNCQMLQNMKKYIKKGQRIAQLHGKTMSQSSPHYGLDIKGIDTKKVLQNELKKEQNQLKSIQQLDILKLKQVKKYSMSSLLVVKKPKYITAQSTNINNPSNIKSKNIIIKNKKITVLQSLLCKRNNFNIIKSPSKSQNIYQNHKAQQNTLSIRFQTMINSLNLILNSFKCLLNKQIIIHQILKNQKKLEKYTYYIGYGNNTNLIRSIMKKRWWWTQVHEIKDANFVWTQLKVNIVLDQIQNCKQYLPSTYKEQTEIQQIDENFIQNQINNLQDLSPTQITIKKKPKVLINNPSFANLLKKQEKICFIFHKSTPYQNFQITNTNFKQNIQNFRQISQPKVVHNHYRLNYMFGNKNALFHNLKTYFQFINNQQILYKFLPKTYYLQKTNKPGIKDFYQRQFLNLNSLQKETGKKSKNIWIVKPAQNSNRGQGISVHSSFDSIRKQICSNKQNGKFIVQSYLRNLFLYQKRKFDIRAYLLMVTIGSTTKYFWYNQGYIRTSSQYYNTNDIDNIYIHLTNDAIQCDSEKYGMFQPGNKINYSQFQLYLDSNYQKQKYSIEELNKQMKSIAKQAVNAIYPKVKSQRVDYTFELFGLDFLIDNNFNPFLLQINTNPCLQLACPVLQRLIPRMLQNMYRICLDSVYQPFQQVSKVSSYFIYDNLLDINRFELIFDSNYDQNLEWMDYCRQLQEKVYADDNEVFENDGQQVEVDYE